MWYTGNVLAHCWKDASATICGGLLMAMVCATVGCGGPSAAARRIEARVEAGGSPLERYEVDERPSLTLLARSGDPQAAVAFVASHARGSEASAALVGLLKARLQAAGIGRVNARAHALGVELSLGVDSPAEAARFIHATCSALSAPVQQNEPAVRDAQREFDALGALKFAGNGEAHAAACSGELGVSEPRALDLSTRAGWELLEGVRAATFRAAAAGFAVLGQPAYLDSAAAALAHEPAWPTRAPEDDAWPQSDLVSVEPSSARRGLTLALRVADAERAVGAGLELGQPGSPLLEHLQAMNPPWRLERTTAVARRRGACLRFDIAPKSEQAPDARELAQVGAALERLADQAMQAAPEGALDQSVLRPTEPGRAAVLAAWRALPSAKEDRAPERRTLVYYAESGERISSGDLEAELARARRGSASGVELLTRAEPGQGEFWLLLASPCGTSAEQSSDAGALSLALRTAAQQALDASVRVEAWVSADGAGLIAHATQRGHEESADAQAVRVARALGQALALAPRASEFAAVREDLLRELGGQARPGWFGLLEGLAPGHPSWLDPRGTFQSLSELSLDAAQRARRALLAGPLRLAVLTNRGEHQSAVAAAELDAWLATFRREPAQCATGEAVVPRRGELALELDQPSSEGAYIGVTFGAAGASAAHAAELAVTLLNRPEGILQRALAGLAPGSQARARFLGGEHQPAVVVQVQAPPDQLVKATAQIRAALAQLAGGGASSAEQTDAARELERLYSQGRFDPRRRLLELFGKSGRSASDPATLRAIFAGFATDSQWIVRVSSAPHASAHAD